MTNKEFLERASKLQKEFAELNDENVGLIGIESQHFQVTAEKFHELEREGLLEHISKKHITQEGAGSYWYYEAMTPQGVKIITIDCAEEMAKK